jgi:hypothetical protein
MFQAYDGFIHEMRLHVNALLNLLMRTFKLFIGNIFFFQKKRMPLIILRKHENEFTPP